MKKRKFSPALLLLAIPLMLLGGSFLQKNLFHNEIVLLEGPRDGGVCGNELCESEETELSCPMDCSWPRFRHKTKSIQDDGSDASTSFTNETLIDKYLANGFNTITSHSNGELRVRYFNFSKYNETHMPPVLVNYSNFSASKGFKYYPMVAWDHNPSVTSYFSYPFERAVLASGVTLNETSFWSEDYWNNLTEIAFRIAKFGNSSTHNVNGIFYDFELYSVSGGSYPNLSWGFENSTWWEYTMENRSITDVNVINLTYSERYPWLVANNSLEGYHNFLHDLAFKRARKMKDRINEVNPDFLIGAYPSP